MRGVWARAKGIFTVRMRQSHVRMIAGWCLSRPYGGEASQMNFLAQSTHKRNVPYGVCTMPVAPVSDFGKDSSHRSQLTVSCESSRVSLVPGETFGCFQSFVLPGLAG